MEVKLNGKQIVLCILSLFGTMVSLVVSTTFPNVDIQMKILWFGLMTLLLVLPISFFIIVLEELSEKKK